MNARGDDIPAWMDLRESEYPLDRYKRVKRSLVTALSPSVRKKIKPRDPARQELAELRRGLGLCERDYLDALVSTRFHVTNANRVYRSLGYTDNSGILATWRRKPAFKRALELSHAWLTQTIGAKVLLQVDALAEHGMEHTEIFDRSGNVVVDENGEPRLEMRDPYLALKANELLGKHVNMWGDDGKGARVVVELINLTGESEKPAIDAEDGEVVDSDFLGLANTA